MNTNKKQLCLWIAILCCLIVFHPVKADNDAGSRYAKQSVLSSGKWIQMQVKENAVYKLTYEDIKKAGINDPSKVKIYGYGGWILDEDFTKPFIDDLPEIAVWMNTGSDGVFNAGDYLLFYGKGTIKWTYNSSDNSFNHENNPYSTYGSYFLTESSEGPKIMQRRDVNVSSNKTLTTFDDYLLHERDSINLINTGRELFGESFSEKRTQNFTFNVPGIVSEDGKAHLSFAGGPPEAATVRLSIDGKEVITANVSALLTTSYYRKAFLINSVKEWTGEKKEQTVVSISYNASGSSYLNYLALSFKRQLRFYDVGYTFFRNKECLTSNVKYEISNAASQSLIWDITNHQNAELIQCSQEGNKLSFVAEKGDALREYVMVDYSKPFPTPTVIGEISNQNLHELPQTDMVIIVPKAFYSYAETLAERHRADGLIVHTVQSDWIYNEFSSGRPDATAYRRFMKMFYDRASTEEEKPKYLLLFGDGIFDNRFLTRSASTKNRNYYLLTYQWPESADEERSYGMDDYFGFLTDSSKDYILQSLEIGIGRFPVSNAIQAENAIKKVISYMDDKYLGDWKNRVIFTADNTDSDVPSSFCIHATQADTISQFVEFEHSEYMITKSFMDAFKPADSNGKKTIPDAKKKLLTVLKEGCLLLNYTGHGSVNAWSGEDLLNITDVRQMNFSGLPLWITATCDFGWFDAINPAAGEEAFLNKESGAIALFTTARVVLSNNNAYINSLLIRNLFSQHNGTHPCLGDVLRISKNQRGNDSNKFNFVLLGDPAMKLNYPDIKVQLETINGEEIDTDSIYTFKALEKVTLSGKITDENGNIVPSFSGKLKANFFDSKQQVKSYTANRDGARFIFNEYLSRVYIGNEEVKDGHFEFRFTVPKDISYTRNTGKMNFYAYDETSGIDAAGSYLNYVLAGSSNDMEYTDEGPEILAMYLNSQSFRNGDEVNETPFFVARVSDENGINLSGNGLGHDIMICIDNAVMYTYTLNSYYAFLGDNKGEIRFPIPELPEGKHHLEFKVWNILNNSSDGALDFYVIKGLKPQLFDIVAAPNPVKQSTRFLLTHDRPESTIEVEIVVSDLSGRVLWTHTEIGFSGWLKEYPVEWTGIDLSGSRVRQGIYLYRAIIKTPEGNETTKTKKIVVLEQ